MQKERIGMGQYQKIRTGKEMGVSGSRFYEKEETSSRAGERDRSASRNAVRSGIKDTKLFVR